MPQDDEKPSKRLPNGRFAPGIRPDGAGKPKGAVTKITKTIKEALLEAANNLGGKQGAVGVFEQAGKKDIVALAQILARTIPLEVAGNLNVGVVGDVNIVSVPNDRFLSKDDMSKTTLPFPPALVIDAVANTVVASAIDEEEEKRKKAS